MQLHLIGNQSSLFIMKKIKIIALLVTYCVSLEFAVCANEESLTDSLVDPELNSIDANLESLKETFDIEKFRKIGFQAVYLDFAPESRPQDVDKKLLQNLNVWVKAINLLDTHLIKNFDFDERFSINVVPPRDGNVFYDSDVDPNSIENIEIREKYITLREEVKNKLEKYKYQEILHDLQPRFLERFKQFTRQTVVLNNSNMRGKFEAIIVSQINNRERRLLILDWFEPESKH